MQKSLEQQLVAALNDTQPLTAVASIAMCQPLAEVATPIVYNSRVNLRTAFDGASIKDLDRILQVTNELRDAALVVSARQDAIRTFTAKLHECYTVDWQRDFDSFGDFLTYVKTKG